MQLPPRSLFPRRRRRLAARPSIESASPSSSLSSGRHRLRSRPEFLRPSLFHLSYQSSVLSFQLKHLALTALRTKNWHRRGSIGADDRAYGAIRVPFCKRSQFTFLPLTSSV